MNSSPAPANNETVAYGQLLALSSKLKRQDQVNLVRALAGQLGMIALFPAQLTSSANSAGAAKAAPKEKKKGPAKQAPSNPLSGSAEKKAFDAAKKAVAKATKDAGGQKLANDHELVRALEGAKDKYFRALSSAKGRTAEDANASSDEEEEEARDTVPGRAAAKAAAPLPPRPVSPVAAKAAPARTNTPRKS